MGLHVKNEIVDPEEDGVARGIQTTLSREIRLGDQFRTVAAAAIAYSRDEKWGYVAAVVLSATNWSVVFRQLLKMPVTRPYEPDLLGFREGPLLLEALVRLPREPDLILIDGSGIAHPRKFGLACHVGLALEHPTVGITKYWPLGCKQAKCTVARRRGSKTALLHETSGDRLGYEVYMQDNTDPVYVSPGHRVSLDDAVSVALRCTPWHRLSEPIRAAENAANEHRLEQEKT
jgi:deoxyribonuclease V